MTLPERVREARTRFLLKYLPTFVRPPVTPEARERRDADRVSAERYPDLLAAAAEAERALLGARLDGRPYADLSERSRELDRALAAAAQAAAAGERATMGERAYVDRVYRRKALARENVRHWTRELGRLRTAREVYRFEAMGHVGTLVPHSVRVGTHAALTPHNESVGAGQPDDAAGRVGVPRVGVDLPAAISRSSTAARGGSPATPAS